MFILLALWLGHSLVEKEKGLSPICFYKVGSIPLSVVCCSINSTLHCKHLSLDPHLEGCPHPFVHTLYPDFIYENLSLDV